MYFKVATNKPPKQVITGIQKPRFSKEKNIKNKNKKLHHCYNFKNPTVVKAARSEAGLS